MHEFLKEVFEVVQVKNGCVYKTKFVYKKYFTLEEIELFQGVEDKKEILGRRILVEPTCKSMDDMKFLCRRRE